VDESANQEVKLIPTKTGRHSPSLRRIAETDGSVTTRSNNASSSLSDAIPNRQLRSSQEKALELEVLNQKAYFRGITEAGLSQP